MAASPRWQARSCATWPGRPSSVHTAGTQPGNALNAESVQSLAELGIDLGDEHPKPITDDLLTDTGLIITLGTDTGLDPVPGIVIRNWDTEEPSKRGIDGMERMRLVRDDIQARVAALVAELTAREGKAPP